MNEHFNGIVPYLFYDDVEAAIDWYAHNFGFIELGRWHNEDGKIANAEMRVGKTELWLDGSGKRQDSDPRPHWIGIWVDDVDVVHARLKERGVDCEPPVDREFGVRMLTVDDGMGYLWGFIKRRG